MPTRLKYQISHKSTEGNNSPPQCDFGSAIPMGADQHTLTRNPTSSIIELQPSKMPSVTRTHALQSV